MKKIKKKHIKIEQFRNKKINKEKEGKKESEGNKQNKKVWNLERWEQNEEKTKRKKQISMKWRNKIERK